MIDPLTGTLAATAAVVAGVGAVGVNAVRKEGKDMTFEEKLNEKIQAYERTKKDLENRIRVLTREKAECESKKPASTPAAVVAPAAPADPASPGILGTLAEVVGVTPPAATNDTAGDPTEESVKEAPSILEAVTGEPVPVGDTGLASTPVAAKPEVVPGLAAALAAASTTNETAPVFQDGQPAPPHTVNPDFIEPQEGAGCGRHALNNFLGGRYFVRDDGTNINSIGELRVNEVSLQTLCRYIRETAVRISGPERTGGDYCPDDENYDYNVLDAAFRLYGYKLGITNHSPTQPLPENERTAGFLLRKRNPEHWYVFRKEQGGGYTMLDSLGNNGQGTKVSGTLEELRQNHAQNGAFQIFSIETTGTTSDLKQEMLRILPLTERVTQAKEKAANITNNSSPMGLSERITTANKERQQDVVTMANLPRSSATVGTPIVATPPPAPPSPDVQAAQTRRKAMRGTPNRRASQTLFGKPPPSGEDPTSFTGTNPLTPIRRGGTMRKKKLRTRRATKQKNVGRTRSR